MHQFVTLKSKNPMRVSVLLLVSILSWAWPPLNAQQDCNNDLQCFLDAITQDQAAQYQHEDVFFFVPASEPIVQKWSYSSAGNFSLEFGGKEVMQTFLQQAIRSQFYSTSTKWKDFEETIKQENPYLQFRLDCHCTDRELLQQQFRVWALGSYAIQDLARHACVLKLLDEETPSITMARNLDYRLRTLSIAAQTYRGGVVNYTTYGKETNVTFPDGSEGVLRNYYTDHGQGPTAEREGTVLGLDISSADGKTPFRLEPSMSTVEYFQTEDGTSLLQRAGSRTTAYDFPQLYFGRGHISPVQRFSGSVELESPYTQRINIRAEERPAVGQNKVQVKGELVFAFPSETTRIYRDTIAAPNVIKWTSVPLKTGIQCKVKWADNKSTEEIIFQTNNLLINYWSSLRIYDLKGELLWETEAVFREFDLIPLRSEGIIIEQTYSEVSYQRLPFTVNAGLDFMIGK